MSILLDALKRSESQRDLGRVPTLQTTTETGVFATRQEPSWLLVLLVLLAAGWIGWMGWQQFRLPNDWEETHLLAGNQAGENGQAATPPQAESSSRAAPGGKSILPQMPKADSSEPAAANETAAAQRRLSREVRDYAAEEPADNVVVQAGTADSQPRRENAVRQAEVARVEIAQSRQSSASAGEVNSSPSAAEPYEPEIISYWQVPEKMREGLPELRLSVLVYAESPENRFVLLNGERLREGQQLPNGLLLEEVRRDRAIFNYRNYRFFLKS